VEDGSVLTSALRMSKFVVMTEMMVVGISTKEKKKYDAKFPM
jgi:hypothetical protein